MKSGRRSTRWMTEGVEIQMERLEAEEGGVEAEAGQTRAEVAHPGGPTPSPWVPQASRGGGYRGPRSELKSCDQILKQRWKTEKQRFLQSGGLKKLRGMGKQRLNDQKKFGFSPDVHKKGQMKRL